MQTIFEGGCKKPRKPFYVNVYYNLTESEIEYGNVHCKTREEASMIAKSIYPPIYRIRVVPKV